ncbi:MAG: type II toxin-antitoxin system HicB family antitoxin [Thermoplasmatota archaeon]
MTHTMQFTVTLEKQPTGGYTVQCIELPGAISQGDTRKEALENIQEAIQLILEVRREEALKRGTPLETVEVDA